MTTALPYPQLVAADAQPQAIGTPDDQISEPVSDESVAVGERRDVAETLVGVAVTAGAAYGVYRIGKWLSSRRAETFQTAARPEVRTISGETAQWVMLDSDSAMAVQIELDLDREDIWQHFAARRVAFQDAVAAEVAEWAGEQLTTVTAFSQGSLRVSVFAWVKDAWSASGTRSATEKVEGKVDVADLSSRLQRSVAMLFRGARKVTGVVVNIAVRQAVSIGLQGAFDALLGMFGLPGTGLVAAGATGGPGIAAHDLRWLRPDQWWMPGS